MQTRTIARSPSLAVVDYVCTAGPGDQPFVEVHDGFSISYVKKGSFGYRLRGEMFELVAGSVLVGYPGDEYVCTHDHHVCGDECLSFRLEPALAASLAERPDIWRTGCVPPLPDLMVLGELAQAAAEGKTNVSPEEVGLLLSERFTEIVSGQKRAAVVASPRDRRRAVEAALFLEENSHEILDLEGTARKFGLSAFHFLRLFSKVIGVTPHQYLVRSRLRRAARLLADGPRSITEIALDVGFADLSNFVRTFHRAAGISPRDFRKTARGQRQSERARLVSSF